jgi:hypothetical protein
MTAEASTSERWKANFIVDGLLLPTRAVSCPSWLSFEKLDDSRARAVVLVVVPSAEDPVNNARKQLLNFLSLYNVVARGAARIERDEGASRISGTGFLTSVSGTITIHVKPVVSEERILALFADVTALLQGNEEMLDKSEYFHMRLAIDYYNFGKSSARREESLVNWMIVLEALYSDSPQELGQKLSVRVAWMLGETPQERLEIAKQMRRLYRLRSKVVHGTRAIISDVDIRTIETYARESIIRLLMRSDKPTKESILREFDQAALGISKSTIGLID